MRFFLDHDVPADVARVLRREGHEVVELRDEIKTDAPDEEVFAWARQRKMLMVTGNRDDFLELASQQEHPGLIILIRRRSRQVECAHLLSLIDRAGEAGLHGNINFA